MDNVRVLADPEQSLHVKRKILIQLAMELCLAENILQKLRDPDY
jgi:hypothetical protein